MKLRLAKASQLSWSWGLAWLSLAKVEFLTKKYGQKYVGIEDLNEVDKREYSEAEIFKEDCKMTGEKASE